jgi:hypothetical protein
LSKIFKEGKNKQIKGKESAVVDDRLGKGKKKKT